MSKMQDWRIRTSVNRPHFDNATRQPDQFANVLAALLYRRACLKALPVAARQNGLLKIVGRGA
jgi:hypothetical protein